MQSVKENKAFRKILPALIKILRVIVSLPPLLAFVGDTQLREKNLWKTSQPGDVFSEKPVKIYRFH